MYNHAIERSENLEDLREGLTRQIAWFLVASGVFVVWINLPLPNYPYPQALFAAALIGLGSLILHQYRKRPRVMRAVLLVGMNLALLAAMLVFDDYWIPFLGLVLTFAGSILLPMGGAISTLLTAVLALGLVVGGGRQYAYLPLVGALCSGVALSWLVVNKTFTALEWARSMHAQVNELLEETRERRAELVRTVRLLEQTNAALYRTQSELDFARRQAEEARRLKQQFVANISHELRAPLNLILGFSEIMYQSPGVYGDIAWPPRLRQDISKIYRSSRHLLGMIDDILDLAYFGAVGYMLNLEPTPMSVFLEEAAEIASDLFRGKDVRLVTRIDPDLPTMVIDRTRVRQVVLNLLNNAQRYTDRGTVTLKATLDEKQALLVSVSDTGRGIPEDSLSSIFEEFHQADPSLRRQNGGAGLGLTISKKFIEAHGGRIWVKSEVGKGSTFTFALAASDDRTAELKPDKLSEPRYASLRPCALILTANPAAVPLLNRHIQDFEFIPLESPGGIDEAARQNRPRALIVDMDVSPDIVGRLGRDFPIPIITFSLPKQVWVDHDLSTLGYMIKPVGPQQLTDAVDRVGNVHRILVVDDDINFIHLIERIVQTTDRDIELRRASTVAEAVSQIRRNPPDLILLDLMMPTLEDGYRVLEEIHADPQLSDVPVILLTSSSYTENMIEHGGGPVSIRRQDGLYPAETLRYLRAILSQLESYFDKPAAT